MIKIANFARLKIYVRGSIRRSGKGGRVVDYNRYFESEQFDKTSLTIKKHLNIDDNEI